LNWKKLVALLETIHYHFNLNHNLQVLLIHSLMKFPHPTIFLSNQYQYLVFVDFASYFLLLDFLKVESDSIFLLKCHRQITILFQSFLKFFLVCLYGFDSSFGV
jgi:hypothetical protein